MFRIHPLTVSPLSTEGRYAGSIRGSPSLTRGDCSRSFPRNTPSHTGRLLTDQIKCFHTHPFVAVCRDVVVVVVVVVVSDNFIGQVKPARITSSRSHNSGRMTFVASCFMLAVDIKRLTCTNQRLPSQSSRGASAPHARDPGSSRADVSPRTRKAATSVAARCIIGNLVARW